MPPCSPAPALNPAMPHTASPKPVRGRTASLLPAGRQMPPSPHPFGVFAFRESFSQAPITHTYSLTQFTLTQLAPLALRARSARATRSPHALAPLALRARFARATRSRLPHQPANPRAKPPAPLLSSGLTTLQCSPRRGSLSLAPSG